MLYGNKTAVWELQWTPTWCRKTQHCNTQSNVNQRAYEFGLRYSYVCLFFDALLKRVLFLDTLHAVDHFQNITRIYEEAEVGSFRARDQVQ
jgi:hypothetical protein